MNRLLWALQGLLAGLFLFTGAVKWALPVEPMAEQVHLPAMFLRFVGTCEMLGAVGLILPLRAKIMPVLTPIAAACLMVIVICATVVTIVNGQGVVALLPAVTAVLCAFVAWGRWRLVP
jgi:hypothetical protein